MTIMCNASYPYYLHFILTTSEPVSKVKVKAEEKAERGEEGEKVEVQERAEESDVIAKYSSNN